MSQRVLKIRIVLDHEDQVFRDILVEDGGSMEDLHETLLAAFNISNDEMASFYESDEHWNKGAEIALMDMGTSEDPVKLMSETPMASVLSERARLLYVYDFLNLKIFYVEVIGIEPPDEQADYPLVVLAYGEMPKEKNALDLESLMQGLDLDEGQASSTDDEPFDDEWEDEGGGMDNIDDYEGLI